MLQQSHINIRIYNVHYIDYRITNSDYVNMFIHCIYLSDWLSVSAYICCLISVIGILIKSCIGAPFVSRLENGPCVGFVHTNYKYII